jgi:hypothetical protein
MNTLFLAGTEDTPEVNFNYGARHFVLSGRSLPEDVTAFFAPLFEWLEEFSAKPLDGVEFQFRLEYFNTASSKLILDFLMKLEEINASMDGALSVSWYYTEGDDDMMEAGEEYKDLVEIPFSLIVA